jgi:hypothetical protein
MSHRRPNRRAQRKDVAKFLSRIAIVLSRSVTATYMLRDPVYLTAPFKTGTRMVCFPQAKRSTRLAGLYLDLPQ